MMQRVLTCMIALVVVLCFGVSAFAAAPDGYEPMALEWQSGTYYKFGFINAGTDSFCTSYIDVTSVDACYLSMSSTVSSDAYIYLFDADYAETSKVSLKNIDTVDLTGVSYAVISFRHNGLVLANACTFYVLLTPKPTATPTPTSTPETTPEPTAVPEVTPTPEPTPEVNPDETEVPQIDALNVPFEAYSVGDSLLLLCFCGFALLAVIQLFK